MTVERTGSNSLQKSVQVLLEAPFNPQQRRKNSVLLTIDLTKAVADEAIDRGDSVVVSYRMHLSPTLVSRLQREA